MYYFETFREKECLEINTKSEPLSFIENKYKDGSCMKYENEFKFLNIVKF